MADLVVSGTSLTVVAGAPEDVAGGARAPLEVIAEVGEATTLYHGSEEPDITHFESSSAGPRGYFGSGVYTTPEFDEAAFYGRYVYELAFSGTIFDEIYAKSDRPLEGDRGDVYAFSFVLNGQRYISWDPREEEEAQEQEFIEQLARKYGRDGLERLADEVGDDLGLRHVRWGLERALKNPGELGLDPAWRQALAEDLAKAPTFKSDALQIDADEIGNEVEHAGYDAVLIPGLEANYGHTEILVFDASKLRIVRVHDTGPRQGRRGSVIVRAVSRLDQTIDDLAHGDFALQSQYEEAARELLSLGYEEEEVIEALGAQRKLMRYRRTQAQTPGAFLIARRDQYDVYRIQTFEAAQRLGTQNWCIARARGHWESYTNRGIRFYFFVDREVGPPAVFATAVRPDAGRTETFGPDDDMLTSFEHVDAVLGDFEKHERERLLGAEHEKALYASADKATLDIGLSGGANFLTPGEVLAAAIRNTNLPRCVSQLSHSEFMNLYKVLDALEAQYPVQVAAVLAVAPDIDQEVPRQDEEYEDPWAEDRQRADDDEYDRRKDVVFAYVLGHVTFGQLRQQMEYEWRWTRQHLYGVAEDFWEVHKAEVEDDQGALTRLHGIAAPWLRRQIDELRQRMQSGQELRARRGSVIVRANDSPSITREDFERMVARANVADDGRGDYLTSIFVDPAYRRRGVARALYDAIEAARGAPLRPSPTYRTPDGVAFWRSRTGALEVGAARGWLYRAAEPGEDAMVGDCSWSPDIRVAQRFLANPEELGGSAFGGAQLYRTRMPSSRKVFDARDLDDVMEFLGYDPEDESYDDDQWDLIQRGWSVSENIPREEAFREAALAQGRTWIIVTMTPEGTEEWVYIGSDWIPVEPVGPDGERSAPKGAASGERSAALVVVAAGPELIERLVKRWPALEVGIRELATNDPTGDLRWLDWGTRQLRAGSAANEVVEVLRAFFADRDTLGDPSRFKTLDEARAAIEAARAPSSGRAEVVYSKDGWTITQVFDREALFAVSGMRPCKWCVGWETMEHWNQYTYGDDWEMFVVKGPVQEAPYLVYFGGAMPNEVKDRGNADVSNQSQVFRVLADAGLAFGSSEGEEGDEAWAEAASALARELRRYYGWTRSHILNPERTRLLRVDTADPDSEASHVIANVRGFADSPLDPEGLIQTHWYDFEDRYIDLDPRLTELLQDARLLNAFVLWIPAWSPTDVGKMFVPAIATQTGLFEVLAGFLAKDNDFGTWLTGLPYDSAVALIHAWERDPELDPSRWLSEKANEGRARGRPRRKALAVVAGDERTYIDAREYEQALRSTYHRDDGSPIEGVTSRTHPQTVALPAGEWMIDNSFGHDDGHDVWEKRDVRVADLLPSEDTYRRDDVLQYALWLLEGREPPPIKVVQTAKGALKTMDHRRVLAALAVGRETLPAWISWSTRKPNGSVVGMTRELLESGSTPLPVTAPPSKDTIASFHHATARTLAWVRDQLAALDSDARSKTSALEVVAGSLIGTTFSTGLGDGKMVVVAERPDAVQVSYAGARPTEDGRYYGPWVPRASFPHVIADLSGTLAPSVLAAGPSGNAAVDAVLEGRGQFLGRGNDGVVWRVGDQVVKAGTVVPYQPLNPGYATPEEAIERVRAAVEQQNKLADEGVPGVPRSELVVVGDKAFQVKPYLTEIEGGLTREHLDQIARTTHALHSRGLTFRESDPWQVGFDPEGRVSFYDLAMVGPGRRGEGIFDDFQEERRNLEGLYRKHGVPFIPPADAGLLEAWEQQAASARLAWTFDAEDREVWMARTRTLGQAAVDAGLIGASAVEDAVSKFEGFVDRVRARKKRSEQRRLEASARAEAKRDEAIEVVADYDTWRGKSWRADVIPGPDRPTYVFRIGGGSGDEPELGAEIGVVNLRGFLADMLGFWQVWEDAPIVSNAEWHVRGNAATAEEAREQAMAAIAMRDRWVPPLPEVQSKTEEEVLREDAERRVAPFKNLRSIYELEYKWSKLKTARADGPLADRAERALATWGEQLDRRLNTEIALMDQKFETWLSRRNRDSLDPARNGNVIFAFLQELRKEQLSWAERLVLRHDDALTTAQSVLDLLYGVPVVTDEDVRQVFDEKWAPAGYQSTGDEENDAHLGVGLATAAPKIREQLMEERSKEQARARDIFRVIQSNRRTNPRTRTWHNVEAAHRELKRAPSLALPEKLVVFHRALTTAHNGGSMPEHIYGSEESGGDRNYDAKGVLTELSNMEVPPEWDREIATLLSLPRGAALEAVAIERKERPAAWAAGEITGTVLGPVYHGGPKLVREVDPEKLQANDGGYYGRGFYVTTDFDTAAFYGPVVSAFQLDQDARVLCPDVTLDQSSPAIVDAVTEYVRGLLKKREKHHEVDVEQDLADEMALLRENPIEWVGRVNDFAETAGFDAVAWSPEEVAVKNPSALTFVERVREMPIEVVAGTPSEIERVAAFVRGLTQEEGLALVELYWFGPGDGVPRERLMELLDESPEGLSAEDQIEYARHSILDNAHDMRRDDVLREYLPALSDPWWANVVPRGPIETWARPRMQKTNATSPGVVEAPDHREGALVVVAAAGFWGKAGAGVLFVCPDDGTMLLTLRSGNVMEPGTWGVPGGAIEQGEDASDGADREVEEELGALPLARSVTSVTFKKGSFTYTTFIRAVDAAAKAAWRPQLNWENDDAQWFPVERPPAPLHFGAAFVLGRAGAALAGQKPARAPAKRAPGTKSPSAATWYHGGPARSDFAGVRLDRDRTTRDGNQEGPGVYLTSDRAEAAGYGPVHEVAIDGSFKMLPWEGPPKRAILEGLLRELGRVDQERLYAMAANWGDEGPAGVRAALDAYAKVATLGEAMMGLYHDFFQHDDLQYAACVRALGYDGFVVPKGGRSHLVVLSPEKLRVVAGPEQKIAAPARKVLPDVEGSWAPRVTWRLTKEADLVPGGVGDNTDPAHVDQAQLERGWREEFEEHTDDPAVAQEIALDHLTKDPEYYRHEGALVVVAGAVQFRTMYDDRSGTPFGLEGLLRGAFTRGDQPEMRFVTNSIYVERLRPVVEAFELRLMALVREWSLNYKEDPFPLLIETEHAFGHDAWSFDQAMEVYEGRARHVVGDKAARTLGDALRADSELEGLFRSVRSKVHELREEAKAYGIEFDHGRIGETYALDGKNPFEIVGFDPIAEGGKGALLVKDVATGAQRSIPSYQFTEWKRGRRVQKVQPPARAPTHEDDPEGVVEWERPYARALPGQQLVVRALEMGYADGLAGRPPMDTTFRPRSKLYPTKYLMKGRRREALIEPIAEAYQRAYEYGKAGHDKPYPYDDHGITRVPSLGRADEGRSRFEEDHARRGALEVVAGAPPDAEREARGGVRVALLREGDKPWESAIVVLPIPSPIREVWPDTRKGIDDSPPHLTVLYVGDDVARLDASERAQLVEAWKEALADEEPFEVQLEEGVAWFHSDNAEKKGNPAEIAHKELTPKSAARVKALHEKLKAATEAHGVKVQHAQPFICHATLGYYPARAYPEGVTVPEGAFVADTLEVWGTGPETPTLELARAPLEVVAGARTAAPRWTGFETTHGLEWSLKDTSATNYPLAKMWIYNDGHWRVVVFEPKKLYEQRPVVDLEGDSADREAAFAAACAVLPADVPIPAYEFKTLEARRQESEAFRQKVREQEQAPASLPDEGYYPDLLLPPGQVRGGGDEVGREKTHGIAHYIGRNGGWHRFVYFVDGDAVSGLTLTPSPRGRRGFAAKMTSSSPSWWRMTLASTRRSS